MGHMPQVFIMETIYTDGDLRTQTTRPWATEQ